MFRKSILSLSLGVAMLAGCGAQPGKSLVKFDTGGVAHKSEAPESGTYALYSKFATNPDVTYELKKGDDLGFVDKDGKILAVAGTHMDEIKPGFMSGYYWKMKEPTMKSDN